MDDDKTDVQSAAGRAAYYRRMALDALKHAQQTKDEKRRDSYFDLARSWHAMAVQIEQSEQPAPVELKSARLRIVDSSRSGAALKH